MPSYPYLDPGTGLGLYKYLPGDRGGLGRLNLLLDLVEGGDFRPVLGADADDFCPSRLGLVGLEAFSLDLGPFSPAEVVSDFDVATCELSSFEDLLFHMTQVSHYG